jgi:hypothetical protein
MQSGETAMHAQLIDESTTRDNFDAFPRRNADMA